MSAILSAPATAAAACSLLIPATAYICLLHRRLARAAFAETHDPLTGLLNRRTLTGCIQAQAATGRPGALLLLDVDWFKDINDWYGHTAGDAVLAELARRLQAADAGPVFRLGGDEFAVLVTGDADCSLAVAWHLWTLIRTAPFALPAGQHITVQASIGIADQRLGIEPASLLHQADTALLGAKQTRTVASFRPGAQFPALRHGARHRQRDRLHRPVPPAPMTSAEAWRCLFDAATIAPLADHAITAPRHHRTGTEQDLLQNCPGGLAIVAERGRITALSTGYPPPLSDPADPDSFRHALAISDSQPIEVTDRQSIAHLHLDHSTVDAIHRAADWGGLLEVTVAGEEATFTITRPGIPDACQMPIR